MLQESLRCGFRPNITERLRTDTRVVIEVEWREGSGDAERFFQVLTCRHGRIVHIQDCRKLERARRLAA